MNITECPPASQKAKPVGYEKYGSPEVIFGISIIAATLEQALGRVESAVIHREEIKIGVVNAAKVVNMRYDGELREAVLESDVVYADGVSVVWASRILGKPLPERVAGIDLMLGILEKGQRFGWRVYCLGATQDVLNVVCEKFRADYPGIELVGTQHGYFSVAEEAAVATAIRDAKPQILFVAITSPKKERFMARWGEFMQVLVVHGVGGSFDVVAGLVKRAPAGWQRAGFEWLYRTLQEPRRLWKRYLVTNTIFIGLVIKEAMSTMFSSSGGD